MFRRLLFTSPAAVYRRNGNKETGSPRATRNKETGSNRYYPITSRYISALSVHIPITSLC